MAVGSSVEIPSIQWFLLVEPLLQVPSPSPLQVVHEVFTAPVSEASRLRWEAQALGCDGLCVL